MSVDASNNGLRARDDGVVEVNGRMTFQTVPEFVARTHVWLNGDGDQVTLDLGQVSLIDSAGVALMLEWMDQARAKRRRLRFINLTNQVRHLIAVNGLDQAFGLDGENPKSTVKTPKTAKKGKKPRA